MGLLVDRRFRGVQVLGAVVVIGELASPETNDVPSEVTYRPHEPAAEPVVHTTVALTDQSPAQQFLISETLTAQEAGERVPGLRSEPDTKVLSAIGVESARFQELTPGSGRG